MSLLLVVLPKNPFTPAQTDHLTSLLPPHMQLQFAWGDDAIEQLIGNVEIAAGWFNPKWIQQAPKLRWFQQWAAGADWVLRFPQYLDLPFVLTNVSGVHAVPISEHIFAMLLSLGRNLRAAENARRDKVWARLRQVGESLDKAHDIPMETIFELAGKTMLLIGVGAIGARTAKLAAAFDMEIIGVRRHVDRPVSHIPHLISPDQLHDAIPKADVIVVTVPLTPETTNLLDFAEFDLMKSDAVVINVGRGGSINDDALLHALQQKKIRGAAVDVLGEEPLPAESPFWQLENLLITSHYAGGTPNYTARAFEIFANNLERYIANQPLINVVDRSLGY